MLKIHHEFKLEEQVCRITDVSNAAVLYGITSQQMHAFYTTKLPCASTK